MTDMTVQVGEGGKKRKPWWQFVLIFVVVVVVAGGAGFGLRWLVQYRDYKNAAKPDAVTLKAEEAQNLANTGKYDEALEATADALKNPQLSLEQKHQLFYQQGLTYENQQKYDLAIQNYKQAEAIKELRGLAEAMARVYELQGDKAQAIAYYKKAIRLIPADYPLKEDTKSYYEQSIANLESAQ